MVIVDEIRGRAKKIAGSVLGALIVAYFVHGTVQGDRGLVAYISISQEMDRAETTLETLRKTRRGIEGRVALLRPETLDLDLLEERARVLLNYVKRDDFVLLIDPDENF